MKDEGTKRRRRNRRLLVDQRMEFMLLGDDRCMWCDLPRERVEAVPLVLGDGRTIEPGTRLTTLGGKRTAAGYSVIRMLDGCWLEYLGQFTNLEGTLVLFQQTRQAGHLIAYWHHGVNLFHFTSACAGRQVETTHCVIMEMEVPA